MAKRKTANRKSKTAVAIAPEYIDRSILIVRGQKVLLDSQLAAFYGVLTKALVQAVKRNADRFPHDFMFRLNADEWHALRSQIATSSAAPPLRSQTVTLKRGRGQHPKYAPFGFTEQGVAMLSSVLRSPRAVEGQHPNHAGLRPTPPTAQRSQGIGRSTRQAGAANDAPRRLRRPTVPRNSRSPRETV